MDHSKIKEILDAHKVYVDSNGLDGEKACFIDANLNSYRFSEIDLSYVDFSNANLSGAAFNRCVLRRAIFTGANMQNIRVLSDMEGAYLAKVNLKNAILSHSKLKHVHLNNTSVEGATLVDTDLTGAYLYETDLRKTNLSGATVTRALLPPNTYFIYGYRWRIDIIQGEWVRVGCQYHTASQWRGFTRDEIHDMDQDEALDFYPTLIKILDFYGL